MEERPLAALLGKGARYSGDLTFEGRVRIDGRYEGKVFSDDLLEVGEEGCVVGELDVALLVVAGTVEGVIRVRERLTVLPGGLVKGKVDAAAMDVRPGGRFEAVVRVGGA